MQRYAHNATVQEMLTAPKKEKEKKEKENHKASC